MRNVIKVRELIEADSKMPQSREAGNLLYVAQAVAMKVKHLEIQCNNDGSNWNETASYSTSYLKRQSTYCDLTEDIGSGNTKQNFIIQAQ